MLRCRLAVIAVAGLAAGGCSAAGYKEEADRESYAIVQEKQMEEFGETRPFSIDPPLHSLRQQLLEAPLPAPETPAPPPLVLTLADCLDVAAENNRELQRQKDLVFLSALSLTLARFEFENQWFGLVSATGERNGDDVKSLRAEGETGFTRLFATGLQAMASIGNSFLRIITHPSQRTDTSFLSLVLSQPLLRGAGATVVREPLVQAERDALYAVREYERFRQVLAVRIATAMYRVLQQRDQVTNEAANAANLKLSRERTESLAEAGRIPRFQVDQARQDELRATNRAILAQAQYATALDDFRIVLGLPPDAPVEVSDLELPLLVKRGLEESPITQEEAVAVGLEERLDLENSRDRVEDARRRIDVAANALEAGLNITFAADVRTEGNTVTKFEFERTDYILGIDLDLPFNRVAERNAYRASFITLAQRMRDESLEEDSVKQEARQALRRLNEARESYAIQTSSVKLAEQRIESTTLLQQAGRAETRDILDAQAALVESQNALTAALVDHTIAKLDLLRDTGVLRIEPEGLGYDDSLEPLLHAAP